MPTAHVHYLGELRTECTHVRSGSVIVTDAPPDNQGRGEAFSPTDLLSTSLACCLITVMGIRARDKGYPLSGLSAEVHKHMVATPRRVMRIEVAIVMDGNGLSQAMREELEHVARTCPVALSLHPDLEQEIHFSYL